MIFRNLKFLINSPLSPLALFSFAQTHRASIAQNLSDSESTYSRYDETSF